VTLLTDQLELGWRFDPGELRDPHGRWTHSGQGYQVPDTNRLSIPRPAHPTKPYYGHPREHPFFAAHPVSAANIVAAFDQASPEETAQGMRWYADAHNLAKAIGGGDVTKGAGLLAAYSPQSPWPVNMFNASRAVELGHAIGPGEGMITGSMQHHAAGAMSGLGTEENFGKGAPKIHAFAKLIENGGDAPGDTEGQVVLDRHAMSVAMGVRLPKKEADAAPIDKARYYQHVADQYRIAAAQITARGTPIAPHQLQAITWLRQQRANAAEDRAGGVGHGGKGAGKGRQVMIQRAWDKWQADVAAEGYPVVPGTTSLAGLITDQLDLAGNWRDAWMHERRAPDGRWVRGAGGEATIGFDPVHQNSGWDSDVTADIEYMSDATKRAATEEIDRALNRHRKLIPGIVEHQAVTFTNLIPDSQGDPGVQGETMPDGTIFIRPDTTDVIGDGFARRLEKEQEADGYWVPTASRHSLAEVVMAHEMGHVVGEYLTKRNPDLLRDIDYWRPIALAVGIQPPPVSVPPGKITIENLADWADRNSYALTNAISVYGISSPYEMQGELWAEFTLNRNPRPAAKAFGEYVLSHLPAKYLPQKKAA
jgi:hypothetical protein